MVINQDELINSFDSPGDLDSLTIGVLAGDELMASVGNAALLDDVSSYYTQWGRD